MKDSYDLLFMILDDFGIYIPVIIFVGILYITRFEPWKLLCGFIGFMVISNFIKWMWKK